MAGIPIGTLQWFQSPAGQEFMEWLRAELELSDTLTPQEMCNRYERKPNEPPIPIDTSVVLIREGRLQVYRKLQAIVAALDEKAKQDLREMVE